jgi:hypothetical protein
MLLGMMLSVVVGAAIQRVTGLGFALVSAPLLVLVSDPITGVLLANLLTLTTNLVVLTETWRQVDLRRVVTLAIPAICCVPVGALVARHLPQPALLIGIGGLVLGGLAALQLLGRSGLFSGTAATIAAGALSGFMNATAGVGGPAAALYAIASRWPYRSFVGSMQFYFVVINAVSIAVKGLPHVGAMVFVAAFAALGCGVVLGHFAARRVSPEQARVAILVLATAGALGTILKGLVLALT